MKHHYFSKLRDAFGLHRFVAAGNMFLLHIAHSLEMPRTARELKQS